MLVILLSYEPDKYNLMKIVSTFLYIRLIYLTLFSPYILQKLEWPLLAYITVTFWVREACSEPLTCFLDIVRISWPVAVARTLGCCIVPGDCCFQDL